MDALILPGLAATIAAFLIYIAVVWLRDRNNRALGPRQIEDYEEESRDL